MIRTALPLALVLACAACSKPAPPTPHEPPTPQARVSTPWDAMEAYAAFCADRGITMLDATFGWLLAQPGLSSVIAGATKPEQIRANAAAADAWQPTDEDVAAIGAFFPANERVE